AWGCEPHPLRAAARRRQPWRQSRAASPWIMYESPSSQIVELPTSAEFGLGRAQRVVMAWIHADNPLRSQQGSGRSRFSDRKEVRRVQTREEIYVVGVSSPRWRGNFGQRPVGAGGAGKTAMRVGDPTGRRGPGGAGRGAGRPHLGQ